MTTFLLSRKVESLGELIIKWQINKKKKRDCTFEIKFLNKQNSNHNPTNSN